MPDPHFISKFVGLTDSVNPYAAAPEGGCSRADDAVIRSRDLIESRRGYASVTSASPINALGWKEGKLLCLGWDDPGRGITGQLRYYDFTAGAFTSLPMNPGALPFDRPGGVVGQRTRFISAQKATYFMSRYGLTKAEALSTSVCRPALATAPWVEPGTPLLLAGSQVATGAGTWLANNFQVAYRITICRLGANKELIESAPSARLILSNTSGSAKGGALTLQNSWMIPSDAFFRVYRSKQFATSIDPDDEMFLIGEATPVALLDANGYGRRSSVTFSDQTPDTSLYVPLYTNPISGTGIASAASPAPLAADMVYFKNRLLLLNTTDVQRFTLKMIGTIFDGDTLTLNLPTGGAVIFTFRTSAAPTGRDVQLYTAGTVQQNIENTSRELVARINAYFTPSPTAVATPATLLAQYLGIGVSSLGQVLLSNILPGASTFTVTTSSTNGWGSDYTAGVASDPNAQLAGFSWSQQSQPEAFPLANAAIVGDASSAGQRIIALKEAALIFKKNDNNSSDGLWRWTDDGVNVALQIADPTVRLIAPETAQPLGNYVFALCDAGVMLFTENGQSVNVSHDQTERELLKLMAYVGRDTLNNVAFAVPYEIDGQYILCLPEAPNATSCTLQYVYSVRTQTWERMKVPGVIAGTVDPNSGKLIWAMGPVAMAPQGANNLWVERKNFDSTDYQDPSFSIACPVNTSTLTMIFTGDLRTGSQAIAVGDLIEQPQATYYLRQRVKAVSYNSTANQTTVTLDAVPTHPWSNGQNVNVLKAIQSVLTFLPFHAQRPLTSKEWGDCLLLFRYCDLDFLTVEWKSEIHAPLAAVEPITGTGGAYPAVLDQFGASAFDSTAWDRSAKDLIVKCTIPQSFAECALLGLQLTLGNALCRWELAGINLGVDQLSADVVR